MLVGRKITLEQKKSKHPQLLGRCPHPQEQKKARTFPQEQTLTIFFVGNFMQTVFDFDTLAKLIKKIDTLKKPWKLIFAGDGPGLPHFMEQCDSSINVEFLGRISETEILKFF